MQINLSNIKKIQLNNKMKMNKLKAGETLKILLFFIKKKNRLKIKMIKIFNLKKFKIINTLKKAITATIKIN